MESLLQLVMHVLILLDASCGEIEYIEFPQRLEESYQSFTEANIDTLREAGYADEFLSLGAGIQRYLDGLNTDKY